MKMLPLAFSLQSLVWNFVFFFLSILLLFFIIKLIDYIKHKNLSFIVRLYTAFLIIFLLFSFTAFIIKKDNVNKISIYKKNNVKENFNVLFILLDAVRVDHLGCYGYEKETSPNIDTLAKKSTLFSNAFAQSSRTHESMPSIFTSIYPSSHNVNSFNNALPDELIIIPQVFRQNGYKTGIFSTNNAVSSIYGYNRGVDEMICNESSVYQKTYLWYLIRKSCKIPFFNYIASNYLKLSNFIFTIENNLLESFSPDIVTEDLISWITKYKNNPFFVYVHYQGAHTPYNPPTPYNKIFDKNFENDPITWYPRNKGMFLPFIEGTTMPSRDKQNMIAQYDGEILFHDENLGILFNHLKKIEIDTKTIIIITADHGEEFYEHNGWGHGHSLFDEIIHVPLIIYYPDKNIKGKKIDQLVELVDIFPTLNSLCGFNDNFTFPYELEGQDLSKLILSKNHEYKKEYIFSEVNHGGHWARCIRDPYNKAIIAKFGNTVTKMFFNIKTDPFEKTNIFDKDNENQAAYFNKIDTILKQKRSFDSKKRVLDDKTKEQLRSLGYIR